MVGEFSVCLTSDSSSFPSTPCKQYPDAILNAKYDTWFLGIWRACMLLSAIAAKHPSRATVTNNKTHDKYLSLAIIIPTTTQLNRAAEMILMPGN